MSKEFKGEIDISASRNRVWEVISGHDFVPQWAQIFGSSVSVSGEWKEGGEFWCWGEDGNGLASRMMQCKHGVLAKLEHVGAVVNGERAELEGHHAEWKGLREEFALAERDGGCALSVRSESPDSLGDHMAEKWPLVLQKIKELAEAE